MVAVDVEQPESVPLGPVLLGVPLWVTLGEGEAEGVAVPLAEAVGALALATAVTLEQAEVVKARDSEREKEGVTEAPVAVELREAVEDTVRVGE